MKRTTLPTILVAVYGTLRRNCGNWEYYLNNSQSEFLGECITEPKYTMYSLGGFPAVKEEGNTPITIEVFKVTPEVKENLDALEGYQGEGCYNMYDVTTVTTPFGEATMYVMTDRTLDSSRIVESGDWKKVTRRHR